MTKSPRISVLIPAWQAADTLAECLADVRAQTLSDWENVLILDGDVDGSEAVAMRAAGDDPRIRIVRREHEGLVPALQAGLELVRAPLVARFDADDRMHPQRLERQVAFLDAHPEVDVVTCGVELVALGEPGRNIDGMLRHNTWLNSLDTAAKLRAARFIDAPVAHPAVVFRTETVRAVGGYRQGPFAEDHDLWLRLFSQGVVLDRIPETLVTWRDRAERLTRTDTRYADLPRMRLVHDHLVAAGGPLQGGRCRIWGAGEYGRRHGRELLGRGVEVMDFIDIDPKKIGRTRLGRPVVDAARLGAPDGVPILVAVAARGARELIAAELAARRYREDRDWWAVQ